MSDGVKMKLIELIRDDHRNGYVIRNASGKEVVTVAFVDDNAGMTTPDVAIGSHATLDELAMVICHLTCKAAMGAGL